MGDNTIQRLQQIVKNMPSSLGHALVHIRGLVSTYCQKYKVGLIAISLATAIFFSPVIVRIASYSEGGDAMFNAWTLSRNHHCILRQNCPDYTDANIFYPNTDTFLYSESQQSAGLLTLPLHFINQNPIFANNVWTILSFFFSGLFMYMLALYLSKGNQFLSVLSGLIFEFAPFKMSAVWHLQNISIFYLPLAVLLALKYRDTSKKSFLYLFCFVLALQFNASWYQMIFALMFIGCLLVGGLVLRFVDRQKFIRLSVATAIAFATTLPIAIQYSHFSKSNPSNFGLRDQITYSSSLVDYAIPHNGTLLGKAYYKLRDGARVNSYNPDSSAYHGLTLYIVGVIVLYIALRKKTPYSSNEKRLIYTLACIAVIGFIISLGPFLKIFASASHYNESLDAKYALPLPWLGVNFILPQISFIRAIGRAGILLLVSLCALLALLGPFFEKTRNQKSRLIAYILIGAGAAIEILPAHFVNMSPHAYSYNLHVPAVYEYVKNDDAIQNIIILNADFDYPGAGIPIAVPEQVLWSGYHNKNIYNGYSGFNPPLYWETYWDFLDFDKNDVLTLQDMGIDHVIVDKLLSTRNSDLTNEVSEYTGEPIYSDDRYDIYRL